MPIRYEYPYQTKDWTWVWVARCDMLLVGTSRCTAVSTLANDPRSPEIDQSGVRRCGAENYLQSEARPTVEDCGST